MCNLKFKFKYQSPFEIKTHINSDRLRLLKWNTRKNHKNEETNGSAFFFKMYLITLLNNINFHGKKN